MRGLFRLDDPMSARMDLAVEQLVANGGFLYENVWFHREKGSLWCAVISPWHGPGLRQAEALDLVAGARRALQRLRGTSAALSAATADLDCRFLIIRDDDTSWDVVAELVGDKLEWRLYDPNLPAD